ncbi:hypothetical protein P872_11465 [Rhodonellum psychrophilum GCM71 = DSM 17998]|uniref:Uncharacterized protein n=1 Tax=Rhodonellum psychrophilum GCM71 = DSM 17998 TaxID=1123057 RepID=U5BSZ3_9BACT|nr:hypothetical protein P872_11465 [Rhodonellum psychrophilum GCM71 = DSM 17998]
MKGNPLFFVDWKVFLFFSSVFHSWFQAKYSEHIVLILSELNFVLSTIE